MAGISKITGTSSVHESKFNQLNVGEREPLHSQVESHVEPYELVELFYGNHSVSSNDQTNELGLSQCSSDVPAIVSECSGKRKTAITGTSTSYKCEICNRVFREASHFSKHKRGALCRKSAQKMAKRNMKRISKEKESLEKKNKIVSSPYKPYQCNLCGAKFLDKVNVELHLERTHQTRQPLWLQTSKSGGFACSECELWFVDKTDLRQHQQQHSNNHNHHPPHTHQQNEPPQSIIQQSPVPTPMPPPQYYFQPLQHIQTYPHNQIHHLGPPHPQTPHQTMQQMPPQMGPPQGHVVPAFVVPHPHNQPPTSIPHATRPQTSQSNCGNVSQQLPTTSSSVPHQPPNALQTETPKPDKIAKTHSQNLNNWSSNSRKNICGECGLKFVDPINLELHMQRNHPTSTIVETVGLGGGMTLYKTNTGNPNADSNGINDQPSCQKSLCKEFSCTLCGFKASTMSKIVLHLQIIHNTNNANFISVDSASGSEVDKNSKDNRENMHESKCEGPTRKCDSCFREFDSSADLIRHTSKERNILCSVCNFCSCSDSKVVSHMDASHKEDSTFQRHVCPFDGRKEIDRTLNGNTQAENPSNPPSHSECPLQNPEEINSSGISASNVTLNKSFDKDEDVSCPPSLQCCFCDFHALSGVSLAQHLEKHSSIIVRCCKCNEVSERFVDINNHINSNHYGEITRVSITIKSLESPSVYMFMITPTQISQSELRERLESNTGNERNSEEANSEKLKSEENFIEGAFDENWYACSDCGSCISGSDRLNAHIDLHTKRESGSNEQSLSSQESDPNSSPLRSVHNTLEFRCKECGFWRQESRPVLRHIQAVHMSGNMVHSVILKSGIVKSLLIRVFTPLSQLALLVVT